MFTIQIKSGFHNYMCAFSEKSYLVNLLIAFAITLLMINPCEEHHLNN